MQKTRKVRVTKHRLRSAISRGTRVLDDVDNRTSAMRRLRDLVSQHVSDLGGAGQITHGEALLVQRCAMLVCLLEMQETEFVQANFKAKPTELTRYIWSTGMLNRVLGSLGLARRQKQIGPTFGQLLREDLEQQEREAAEREEASDDQ